MRYAAVTFSLGLIALLGLLIGTGLSAASHTGDVLHLVVEQHSSSVETPSRKVEYWLDESRGLARQEELASTGLVRTSTGPNWLLHVPPAGPALRYETAMGAGPTRSIFASLYYMRDAYRAGAAKLVAVTADSEVVQIGPRTTAYERGSGLPIWETGPGSRIDYVYTVRELLPSRSFPLEFFSDSAGRQVAHTIETTPSAAAAKVGFQLLTGGDELLGRRLEKTLFSYGANAFTLEQVGQVYGDIQVSMSLLGQEPSEVGPGGAPVVTALGPGRLYEEGTTDVRLVVLAGRLATSISAPDRQTALLAAQALRPAN